jgi:hypothetical protein
LRTGPLVDAWRGRARGVRTSGLLSDGQHGRGWVRGGEADERAAMIYAHGFASRMSWWQAGWWMGLRALDNSWAVLVGLVDGSDCDARRDWL